MSSTRQTIMLAVAFLFSYISKIKTVDPPNIFKQRITYAKLCFFRVPNHINFLTLDKLL